MADQKVDGKLIKTWIFAGAKNLSNDSKDFIEAGSISEEASNKQKILIRAIINHPDHDLATHDNDISILKLKTPLTFNNNVTRACLPELSFTPQTQAIVSGWGNTVHGMCTLKSVQDLCKMDIIIITWARLC